MLADTHTTLPRTFEINILIFGIVQILASIVITIGLLKLKKWAYRLGMAVGILGTVSLVVSILQDKVAIETIPLFIATALLVFNKKIFYSPI